MCRGLRHIFGTKAFCMQQHAFFSFEKYGMGYKSKKNILEIEWGMIYEASH